MESSGMKPFHFKRKKENVEWRLFCSVKCTIRAYNFGVSPPKF